MSQDRRVPLLDVNLLVALAWPTHALHDRATRWFESPAAARWATCPVTEAGLLRLSLVPAVAGRHVGGDEALALLDAAVAVQGHQRWDVPADALAAPAVRRAALVGRRQVGDLLLVGVAQRHGGRLVTADRGLREALHPDDRDLVVLVPAG